jgi:hypothetical protein
VQPEVAAALRRLVRERVMTPEQAAPLLREARGELISVRGELRALLYAGVLLVTSGVGLLVKQNLDRIGPLAIAIALGVSAIACLTWVFRAAAPFSWGERASGHVAFDYVLLLGVLLAGTDLAYIETKFTPLGDDWPWHLLVVALIAGTLAVRFDSRVVWSLALSTFAAWAGINVRHLLALGGRFLGDPSVLVSWVACGALFVMLAGEQRRRGRKAHFAPVTLHLGWLLVLVALANGAVWDWHESPWALWAAVLLGVSGGLGLRAYRTGRFALLAMGMLGGYVAVSAFAVYVIEEMVGDPGGLLLLLWFTISGMAAVALTFLLQRRISGDA